MQQFNRFLKTVVIVAILIGLGVVFVTQYSFIFAKTVRGEAMRVERMVDPAVMVGGRFDASKVFAFAVAIRDGAKGEIFTSSSEDSQWAVVAKGQCVEAVFYPYPPWNFSKARTYFNARLVQMYDCQSFTGVVTEPAAGAGNGATTQPTQPSMPTAPIATPRAETGAPAEVGH
jgi:hypothetical protein